MLYFFIIVVFLNCKIFPLLSISYVVSYISINVEVYFRRIGCFIQNECSFKPKVFFEKKERMNTYFCECWDKTCSGAETKNMPTPCTSPHDTNTHVFYKYIVLFNSGTYV